MQIMPLFLKQAVVWVAEGARNCYSSNPALSVVTLFLYVSAGMLTNMHMVQKLAHRLKHRTCWPDQSSVVTNVTLCALCLGFAFH